MSNNYWDEDEDDLDTETDVQMDGSDLLKKLRKAKRSDEKRIKELTEQLEGLSKSQRERVVKEVLEKKGVNPKAQRLILKDLEEISEESVNTWLDDNGDLFGLTTTPEVSEEKQLNLAALRQQDVVTQLGTSPDRAEDLINRINNAASAEELSSIIYSQQQ
jgi:N-acetylglutamate synthase-like GNAT family acetyltransferase